MNNTDLMKKVIELDTQFLGSREQSRRVSIQLYIIRKAFGVKTHETDAAISEYDRKQVLSKFEIEAEFNKYVGFWEWAIKSKNPDKAKSFENDVYYFINGVHFFDANLALVMKESFEKILKAA